MNIYKILRNEIIQCVKCLNSNIDEKLLKSITCEPSKIEMHGDVSTNVALVLSNIFKIKPMVLADKISSEILLSDLVNNIDIVKPGFINISLSESLYLEVINNLLNNKGSFGFENFGLGKKVNIEFVSANPTGPMHVGHARGAVFGDILANLLQKNGYIVDKEYYVNDEGNQIKILSKSVRHRALELIENKKIPMTGDMYPGEYLISVAESVLKKLNNSHLVG